MARQIESGQSTSRAILVIDTYAKAFLNFRGPFLRELVQLGYTVFAAAPDVDDDVGRSLRGMGIVPMRVAIERGGVNPVRDVVGLISVFGVVKGVRPYAVILYTPKGVIYGAIAARFARVPKRFAVITGLGYGFVAKGARARAIALIQRLLYRISLPSCDTILFQNPDDRGLFEDLCLTGKAQLGVVNGSGVDLGRFPFVPARSGAVFLMIGRLLISKGVREYLRAAAILRSEAPGARFLLVGWLDRNNPESISEGELEDLLSQAGAEYVGRLADVRPALAECSVFVLPSYREGTPRSVLEAMSTGRAVVTTDAPGCRETVIDGETGYLVRVGDVAALADAMRRYARDPALAVAHGRAARRLAEAKYDVVKVNHSITELLSL